MTDITLVNEMLSYLVGYSERNHNIPRLIADPIIQYCNAEPAAAIALYSWLEQNHPEILKKMIDLVEGDTEPDATDDSPTSNHPGSQHPFHQTVDSESVMQPGGMMFV